MSSCWSVLQCFYLQQGDKPSVYLPSFLLYFVNSLKTTKIIQSSLLRLTPRIKFHISPCCLQHFWDRCCGSEENGLFASSSLEHKINRIWQHDYCITPFTRFNSQTGDNKIMDGSVFYTRSTGWCGLSFPFTQQIRGHLQACYFCCQMWKRVAGDEKGQFTAGGLKEGIILSTQIKVRDHSLKCLFLTDGTN